MGVAVEISVNATKLPKSMLSINGVPPQKIRKFTYYAKSYFFAPSKPPKSCDALLTATLPWTTGSLDGWLDGQGNAYIKQLLAHCILAGILLIPAATPRNWRPDKGPPAKRKMRASKKQDYDWRQDEGRRTQTTTALTMQLGRGQNEKLI